MIELIVIGFVAGIVAAISPCIIPVLPVVLVAGATTTPGEQRSWRSRSRPLAVVAGLVASFSVLILVGSEFLSLLHLPQDTLRDAGVVLLVLVGLGFLIPQLEGAVERPFARIGGHHPGGKGGGLVLGLGLGVLFVPCAGPILAAITVVGATHRLGLTAVVLTIAFAVGTAVPLLVIAFAGRALSERVRTLRLHAPRVRQVSGVVLVAMALAIGFNAFDGLQRDVPGYTSALQNRIEGGASVRQKLSALTGNGTTKTLKLIDCNPGATILLDCGAAPAFTGITTWLNTPDDRPLSFAGLRGKVVLVDFWTYSCINCQRTLPHVEQWYKAYAKDGLVVVGVHTPEFAFEHVVSNVRTEAAALGVHYPVAIDNNYATWDAYDNEYWPAEYLVDAEGNVRHVNFGESDYGTTENLIRRLLVDADLGLTLPKPVELPDRTPTAEISPETYVGYKDESFLINRVVPHNSPARYEFPATLPLYNLAFGGTWTEEAEEGTAGPGAEMELGFRANDVYLVMGGSGTVDVSINGVHTRTVRVGGVPKLYTLFNASTITTANLQLAMSPGVQAYDFTFG